MAALSRNSECNAALHPTVKESRCRRGGSGVGRLSKKKSFSLASRQMASIEVKHSPTWDMPHFQFEMWMCCPSPGLGVLGLELGSSQSLGFSGSDQGAQRVPAAGGRYL